MPARAAAKKRSVVCAGPTCKVRFTPQRATAKYHAAACREAARRARAKDAEQKPAPAKKAAAKKAGTKAPKRTEENPSSAADNHKLVVALRQELETAKVDDTFEGQLAIELARRLVNPESSASALADKVRAARAEALALSTKPPTSGDGQPADEEDEVTRARKQREKSRQEAGLS